MQSFAALQNTTTNARPRPQYKDARTPIDGFSVRKLKVMRAYTRKYVDIYIYIYNNEPFSFCIAQTFTMEQYNL